MECLTKFCVCLFFVTVTVHGVSAALLQACDDNTPCTGTGGDPKAVCAKDNEPGGDGNGNCICTGAFKKNANSDGCVAKGLLDVCADDPACKVDGGDQNAVCSKDTNTGGDNDGNCICTGAFKKNSKNDGCVAKVITDNDCTSDAAGNTKCQGVDPNAVCSDSPTKCACKTGYFLSSDKTTCVQKISTVSCTPDDATQGTPKCQKADKNSECPAEGDKCACKDGYSGTDSCTKDAGSSATSAWMTTSLIATSLLMYLPRLVCG